MSKKLSKYISFFDYFDKSLIVLSVTSGGVSLGVPKLNSIESKISEALISNQISHEGFITIINEERNYRELKVRMMKGQEDKK